MFDREEERGVALFIELLGVVYAEFFDEEVEAVVLAGGDG
jgi:hypothetical protein